MSFSFIITAPDDVPAALKKTKRLIDSKGGSFSGDERSGSFAGKTPLGEVKGRYSIDGATGTITITDKPWLLPEGTIKAAVTKYFAG